MIRKIKMLRYFMLLIGLFGLAGCEQVDNAATQPVEREVLRYDEYAKEFPPYTIHANALTSDQLTAEVAQAYQIARSKNRVILNVSVTKATNAGQQAVKANIKATVRNLNSQFKQANLREIVDSGEHHDAIYYIAQFQITNGETLIFDLDITPEQITQPYALSLRRTFFTE